ncbi:MAG: type IV secretion system protein VirB10 [bacterium]
MKEDKDGNLDYQSETAAIENGTGEDSPLFRQSILGKPTSIRRYGLMGILLVGFVLIAAILVFGGKKEKKAIQPEENFQMPAKRALELPKPTVPTLPIPPKEEKIDKDALALKDARLKSAIIIYQNTSPAKAPASEPGVGPLAGDPNQQFQEQAQSQTVQTSQAYRIGNLETKILQGKLIDAVMETAINSDLPGMVRAVISTDVYGESGRIVLLPQGTRLVGTYNSAIRKGQARVFVIWNRAIRPDGIEIALNSGGTDTLGRAGIGGEVNNHFWQIFGTSALLSLIGAGASSLGVESGDQNNSLSAYREGVTEAFQASSAKVLDSYIDIPPTISVKQGSQVKVFVARDLDFSEALSRASNPILFGASRTPWVSAL